MGTYKQQLILTQAVFNGPIVIFGLFILNRRIIFDVYAA